jgi:uronate dehydrogenase
MTMQILITGGAGHIASIYRAHVGDRHRLRLLDVRPVADPGSHEAIVGQLSDMATVQAACQGIDAVIHLGADPNVTAPFHESLLTNNYVATHNVFAAAQAAGCQRVIFASTNQTTAALPAERINISEDEICPGSFYAVSKCYGEALGRYYAAVHGLRVICLRFGWVAPAVEVMRAAAVAWWPTAYLGPRDLCQILDLALTTDVPFGIFNAVSDNANGRLDLSRSRAVLGFQPQEHVEDLL